MILHWPKIESQPGYSSGVSPTSQNELNYCESLFIYLFQQLGLSYNSNLALPTNNSSLPTKSEPAPNPNALQPSRGVVGKACRIDGVNFMSLKDYETYCKQELQLSKNRQRTNNMLKTKPTDPKDPNYDSNNHWLVGEELAKVIQTDDFVKYDRKISVK